jgi:response regulator of citrate/malate metabolism
MELIKNMKVESITAQDLAKLTGVSRITARRYLDLLEKEGKLVIKMDYGKVGRPINKYTIKED